MTHPLLNEFDDRMWRQHTKATLELDIERARQEAKDFPIALGSLAAQGLNRLCNMYQDPQFGPDFFLKTTKMIRSCLQQYRLCKNNPTEFGRFFHCSTPSPGIVLHFNSVIAKKEIFVLSPPRQKSIKIHITRIIRWHQNRKVKAYNTRQKKLEAIIALREAQLEAERRLNAVLTSVLPLYDQLDRFLEEFRQLRGKMETRIISSKKLHYEKVLERLLEFAKEWKNGVKLREDFDALNPRMFGKKEFIHMRMDHCKTLTKYNLDQGKKLQNIMSMI